MNAIFRATVILCSSSFLSLLLGLVTTKYWAIWLGTDGMGYLGLLTSLLTIITLGSGFGIGTGLVRFGAEAIKQNRPIRIQSLSIAGWLWTGLFGFCCFVLLVVGRNPVSQLISRGEYSSTTMWIACAMLFNLIFNNVIGWLNAHHDVDSLAKINLLNKFLGAISSLLLIGCFGIKGVIASLVVGALLSAILAFSYYRKFYEFSTIKPSRLDVKTASYDLISFGAPYTASMLVGSGIQLCIPFLINNMMNQTSVGYYRPAIMISTVYLGFLLTALAQDYYPRLSSVNQNSSEMVKLANEQHQLLMLLVLPLIIIVMAAGPLIIPLILTRDFMPVLTILRWQLVGDFIKFSSWTLAFILLARNRGKAYFLAETSAGFSLLIGTYLGVKFMGLEGIGLAYLISYVIYYVVVWLLVKKEISMSWSKTNKEALALGLVSIALMQAACLGLQQPWQLPVCILLAILVSSICFIRLNQQYHIIQSIKSRLGKA